MIKLRFNMMFEVFLCFKVYRESSLTNYWHEPPRLPKRVASAQHRSRREVDQSCAQSKYYLTIYANFAIIPYNIINVECRLRYEPCPEKT